VIIHFRNFPESSQNLWTDFPQQLFFRTQRKSEKRNIPKKPRKRMFFRIQKNYGESQVCNEKEDSGRKTGCCGRSGESD